MRSRPPIDPATPDEDGGPRAGRVAIVGRPNVGKSTLLNALVGERLAIVTRKPGTTRSRLLGVALQRDPPTQIAFVDTPGLERPRSVLGRVLVEEAQASLEDADALLFVVDASRTVPGREPLGREDLAVLGQLTESGRPVVLALNKVDRLRDKSVLLPRLAALGEREDLAALVPLSALKNDNVKPVLTELRRLLPPGRLYEDDGFLTDRPERFFAAERVREAVIQHTREEVPYAVAVVIDAYEEDGRLVRIAATLVVDRASHKGIVIGAGGGRLKAIGTDARLALEAFLGRKVFLQLHVKVAPDWTRDPRQVRELTRDPS
ncbi:MAG: GTPase Era [Sandaracinaceae bacterium]